MSQEQDIELKVTDRRLFNPDGSMRDNIPEPEPEPVVAAPPPAPAPAPVRQEEIFSTSSAAQPAPEPVPDSVVDFADDGEEPEMTPFMELIYSLATSLAFIHLGLMEHPATGKAEVNLPAAQQGIGLLMILKEKTVGNLNPQEEEFFTTLLRDLQMQFVSLRGK